MAGWFVLIRLPAMTDSWLNRLENLLHLPRLMLFSGTCINFRKSQVKPEVTVLSPTLSPPPRLRWLRWFAAPILVPLIVISECLRFFVRPFARWRHPVAYAATLSLDNQQALLNKALVEESVPELFIHPQKKDDGLGNTPLTAALAGFAFNATLVLDRDKYLSAPDRQAAMRLIQQAIQHDDRALLTTPNKPGSLSNNKKGSEGIPTNTPLQLAVKAGDVKIVKMLLPHYTKENLLHTSLLGNNALHVAMVNHQWGIAELILQRAATLDRESPGSNVLDSLLRSTNSMGWTPIQLFQILNIQGKAAQTFTSRGLAKDGKPTTLGIPQGRTTFFFQNEILLNGKKVNDFINNFYDALLGGEEARKSNFSFCALVQCNLTFKDFLEYGETQLATILEQENNLTLEGSVDLNGHPSLLLTQAKVIEQDTTSVSSPSSEVAKMRR